ncbi:MAG TPA: ABC transporter permease subunit [Albitalea sp.]
MITDLRSAIAVFRKEWVDALRDRRTLLIVLGSALFMGPLAMVGMTLIAAGMAADATIKEVHVVGADQAPTLQRFIEREGMVVKAVPATVDPRVGGEPLSEPVIVVQAGFEAALAQDQSPQLTLLTDRANPRIDRQAGEIDRLLSGFNRERSEALLSARGLSPQLLEPVRQSLEDVSSQRPQRSPLTALVPFFLIMAVLYGALNAALDATAGERERGSLEPLLTNPAPRWGLVLGKWAAVSAVAMLVATLSCLSFLPAQWVLQDRGESGLLSFGVQETVVFLLALLPLAAALSAVLMAVAIGSKTFKEAQASTTVLILVISVVPLVSTLTREPSGVHLWAPALAQNTLMLRALKGDPVGIDQLLLPFGVCVLVAGACIHFIAGRLQQAAVR